MKKFLPQSYNFCQITRFTLLNWIKSSLLGMSGVKNLLNQLNPELFDTLVWVVQTGKPIKKKIYCKNDEIQKFYEFTIVKFGDGCSITGRALP
ncbi:hypothetical protein DP113_21930 [Brasilonema octagenarum UFV-E1]|uniref:Uncharacterized protein n=1 Tax=Brasilonema sennae CENA114 TaxID=415709 RepID=A0A856MI21_9CYAN|nr:hypothetical protein [Brasilonema sennae]QDL10212.1 hypothetical protein DP114_22010 [Brasilonema sennae CENA114]QDL16564.1 hypothetical protein DP113_21930 [Brasilonema octagenarum UFV-E1]